MRPMVFVKFYPRSGRHFACRGAGLAARRQQPRRSDSGWNIACCVTPTFASGWMPDAASGV